MAETMVASAPVIVRPQRGPQERFLATSADICIYGGAAGGGKTVGLLLEPLRHMSNGDFSATVFRRVGPQITNPGGLCDEAGKFYPLAGAEARMQPLEYRFPSGMRVRFASMQYEANRLDWQGAQIPLIEFDELTHFSESQFFYMLSRNRSTCGVRPYMRATCNPDPDSWVAELIAWWLGEDGYPVKERAGVLRWFVRVNDELVWADTPSELRQRYADSEPKSLTFIGARLEDNPALMAADPGYRANLLALSYIDRERLYGGNWAVRAEAGKLFNRGWVNVAPAAPADGRLVRCWDFAATAKTLAKADPDYAASVLMQLWRGHWYILDATAAQEGPTEVERMFVNQSQQDASYANDRALPYAVRWEIEPGSAAVRDSQRLVAMLAGMDAKGTPSRGDKITRAKPFLAQAEAGNVSIVRGEWNERWLRHMHGQPDLPHDDIWDATSGAFNALTPIGGQRQARSHQG